MATYRGYPAIPAHGNWDIAARNIINRMLGGKLNVAGEVTLISRMASTLLLDEQINATSVILLMPMSANAASALANLWFSTPERGSVVINHSDDNFNDRTFRYIVIG